MDSTCPTTQAYCTDLYIDIAGFNANGECKGDISDFHKKQPLKLAAELRSLILGRLVGCTAPSELVNRGIKMRC